MSLRKESLKKKKKLLDEINPNKSQGPDCLHPKAVKELKYVLAKPLTRISPPTNILYYYYSKKKAQENHVTSGYVVTSTHVTDITSGDVTSGSTPFPNYDGL